MASKNRKPRRVWIWYERGDIIFRRPYASSTVLFTTRRPPMDALRRQLIEDLSGVKRVESKVVGENGNNGNGEHKKNGQ